MQSNGLFASPSSEYFWPSVLNVPTVIWHPGSEGTSNASKARPSFVIQRTSRIFAVARINGAMLSLFVGPEKNDADDRTTILVACNFCSIASALLQLLLRTDSSITLTRQFPPYSRIPRSTNDFPFVGANFFGSGDTVQAYYLEAIRRDSPILAVVLLL